MKPLELDAEVKQLVSAFEDSRAEALSNGGQEFLLRFVEGSEPGSAVGGVRVGIVGVEGDLPRLVHEPLAARRGPDDQRPVGGSDIANVDVDPGGVEREILLDGTDRPRRARSS